MNVLPDVCTSAEYGSGRAVDKPGPAAASSKDAGIEDTERW